MFYGVGNFSYLDGDRDYTMIIYTDDYGKRFKQKYIYEHDFHNETDGNKSIYPQIHANYIHKFTQIGLHVFYTSPLFVWVIPELPIIPLNRIIRAAAGRWSIKKIHAQLGIRNLRRVMHVSISPSKKCYPGGFLMFSKYPILQNNRWKNNGIVLYIFYTGNGKMEMLFWIVGLHDQARQATEFS